VKWIQDVAVAHWFSATTEAQREKYTWVVLRHEIDYKKPKHTTVKRSLLKSCI